MSVLFISDLSIIHEPSLSGITKTAAPLGYQKEVDSASLHVERGGRARVDITRSVIQIQLTGTRGVEMSGGLMLIWVQRKRVKVQAGISRSGNAGSAKLVRHVCVEELRGEDREEINRECLQL